MIYKYYSEPEFRTNVNFNNLNHCLEENKRVYENIEGIEKFIDDWKKVFYDTYKNEENKYFKFTDVENFYEIIKISNFEIRIHFSVSTAKRLLSSYPIQKVPLSAFSNCNNEYSTIKYTDVILNSNYQLEQIPVITVPYFFGGLYYLVIDGNHKITKYKEMNRDNIDTVLLKLPDTVSLINSNFEKAVYLFLNEGSDISKYINNSATQYYKDGKFNL